eukprot:1903223-Ditylum_brightwellii.AAC.1
MINPTHIYCVACQEYLNKALATVASDLHNKDLSYFANYGTTWETADYNVHIKSTTAFIVIGGQRIKTTALTVYSLRFHSLELCKN